MRSVKDKAAIIKICPLSDGPICERFSDLLREMRTMPRVKAQSRHKAAYTFDNVSLCVKDENPLLRKELAASIEVKY